MPSQYGMSIQDRNWLGVRSRRKLTHYPSGRALYSPANFSEFTIFQSYRVTLAPKVVKQNTGDDYGMGRTNAAVVPIERMMIAR